MAFVSHLARAARRSHSSIKTVNSFRFLSTKYTNSHEWIRKDGDVFTVGISAYGADALGDMVYVELPSAGDECTAGESFGSVESVKAVSDVYSPVVGEIVDANAELATLSDDAPAPFAHTPRNRHR